MGALVLSASGRHPASTMPACREAQPDGVPLENDLDLSVCTFREQAAGETGAFAMSLGTLAAVVPLGLPRYGGWFRFSCKEPVGEVT